MAAGRPRSFDRDVALKRAMELFWERGYEAVSLADLTDQLGINKPSLYAAFGCKEALFREAIQLYNATEGQHTEQALRDSPSAREAIEAMMRNNARGYIAPGRPRGCMVVLAASVGSSESAEVREFLSSIRRQGRSMVQKRVQRGIAEGDVNKAADAERVAAFYFTVLQGLSVLARDGASAQVMNQVIDGSLAAWDAVTAAPEPAPKRAVEQRSRARGAASTKPARK